MVSFKNHQKSKIVKLKNAEGVEEDYEFIGLGARHLPRLFKVINAFAGVSETSKPEDIMQRLDEPTVDALQFLIKEMVKVSYKSISEEEVEAFVGVHFMNLINVLFELNMPQEA